VLAPLSLTPFAFDFPPSFFVEIFDFDPTAANSPHFLYPSASYPAEFRISACVHARSVSSSGASRACHRYIFDESNSTIDTFTPLKSLPQWDKRIRSSTPSLPCAAPPYNCSAVCKRWRVLTAYSLPAWTTRAPSSSRCDCGACARAAIINSVLQWYLPGSNEQFSYPIVETDYEFQVYTVDITSYIGSSVQGDATKLVIPARFKRPLSIIHNISFSFSQLLLASTALLFAPAALHVPRPTADRVLRSAQQRALAYYARADGDAQVSALPPPILDRLH
jgi:hypothetical protein